MHVIDFDVAGGVGNDFSEFLFGVGLKQQGSDELSEGPVEAVPGELVECLEGVSGKDEMSSWAQGAERFGEDRAFPGLARNEFDAVVGKQNAVEGVCRKWQDSRIGDGTPETRGSVNSARAWV